MSRYIWTAALLFMALLAMRPTASNAEPPAASNTEQPAIGVAASVKPNAEGVVGENEQTLSSGSELRANETVRTGNSGQAHLVFIDSTNLTVGATSEILLDKFVYDPAGSSGKVVLNATRGTFRFITGAQDHRVYAITTPYGTLGVRGTVVEMKIIPRMVRKAAKNECVAQIKLVSGAGATFTYGGVVHELTEVGTCGCVTGDGHWKVLESCPSLFAEAAQTPIYFPTTGSGTNTPTTLPR
jgi:hypothetical protein